MAGATERAEQIRARCLRLEVSNESICHHVRRPVHAGSGIKLFNRLAHKKTDTPRVRRLKDPIDKRSMSLESVPAYYATEASAASARAGASIDGCLVP